MERHRFTFYNIIGCIAWAIIMLFAGHYLYKLFLNQFGFDLKERLEIIVLGIILVTTAPVLVKLLRNKKG
jgi:membrane-associated protein